MESLRAREFRESSDEIGEARRSLFVGEASNGQTRARGEASVGGRRK